jgi:hypothetical protein
MNINKALEHFKFKFERSWKPTPTDIEAYNAIIDYKSTQESVNLEENNLLAKLWIEKLIMLSRCNMYSGERAIQVIDEILKKPLYDICITLKEEMAMMRFNAVGSDKYPLEQIDILNRTKTLQRNKEIVYNYETELTKALITEIDEDAIIKFVERQINRIINKYEKN